MAGLPWFVIFALIAWVAFKRGWGWAYGLSMFCLGVVAAAGVGGVVTGLLQQMLSGAWSGMVTLLNTAFG